MIIVTLARELGTGGLDIATEVARQLGIPCVDREIISRAAERAGVNERTIEELDEKHPSFIKQILDLMGKYGDQGIYTEWGGPSTLYIPPQERATILDSDTYRSVVEDVIKGIAAQQSAVIVGRAGQVILRDHPHAVHVRIVADLELRIQRTMQRENLSRCAAEKRVKDSDRQRWDYLKSYYKAEWRDPHLYDLVLNSSRLGVQACADLVLQAVADKEGLVLGDMVVSSYSNSAVE